MQLIDFDQFPRNDVYQSASYEYAEDASSLIQTYYFPQLTIRGVALNVVCEFDGTNEIDQRGRYVYYWGSDGSWEEYFDVSPWDRPQGATAEMINVYDNWEPYRRDFGPGGPLPNQADWHSYPQDVGWVLVPFASGLQWSRSPTANRHLDLPIRTGHNRAVSASHFSPSKRLLELSGKV